MLLHYLGKLKNQKFAILMHVNGKTRFKCDFLSSIQQITAKYHENKCKDQHHVKYQHFSFCSFTVLKILKECIIVVWSDFRQFIMDTALDQWRKRLQACVRANGGHFEHLLWTKSCKQLAFSCVLVQVASSHHVRFLLCWCLMVDRLTVQSFKLVKNSEKNKK